jgi:hypothetical protein
MWNIPNKSHLNAFVSTEHIVFSYRNFSNLTSTFPLASSYSGNVYHNVLAELFIDTRKGCKLVLWLKVWFS